MLFSAREEKWPSCVLTVLGFVLLSFVCSFCAAPGSCFSEVTHTVCGGRRLLLLLLRTYEHLSMWLW